MKNQKYIVILLLIILIALIIQVGITYTEGNKGGPMSFREICEFNREPIPLKKWVFTTKFSKKDLADKTMTRDFEWIVWVNKAKEYNNDFAREIDLLSPDNDKVLYSGDEQWLLLFIIRFYQGKYQILLTSKRQPHTKTIKDGTITYNKMTEKDQNGNERVVSEWGVHNYFPLPNIDPPYIFEVWGYNTHFELYNVGDNINKDLIGRYPNFYETLCYFDKISPRGAARQLSGIDSKNA